MIFLQNKSLNCGNKVLDLSTPVVMGILNLTPDSFFDGGSYSTISDIIKRVDQMINEGATIIDIGAISTRPGASMLTESEELNRLIEPLVSVRKEFPELVISIDTFRKGVASAVIGEGADIVNDISGGMLDDEMIPFISKQDAAYVLMHMQGTPADMQLNPRYNDVAREVIVFFYNKLAYFKNSGKHNIILDQGYGFGKNVDHNFKLLGALPEFTALGYPLLVGISRKSMINKVIGTSPANALNGTTVLNTIALMNGANILRVHDVKPAMEAIKLVHQYTRSNTVER